MALAIARRELTAAELRLAARRSKDSDQARRLLAIALVLDGTSRTETARLTGVDRQAVRDWVLRYNAAGVEGLRDRPRSGRPAQLTAAQLAELERLVEAGPDIDVHGVVRDRLRPARCVDLRAEIKQRFDVEVSERHVGRLLKGVAFTRLSVRPRHPEADEAAQEAFKKTSPTS